MIWQYNEKQNTLVRAYQVPGTAVRLQIFKQVSHAGLPRSLFRTDQVGGDSQPTTNTTQHSTTYSYSHHVTSAACQRLLDQKHPTLSLLQAAPKKNAGALVLHSTSHFPRFSHYRYCCTLVVGRRTSSRGPSTAGSACVRQQHQHYISRRPALLHTSTITGGRSK